MKLTPLLEFDPVSIYNVKCPKCDKYFLSSNLLRHMREKHDFYEVVQIAQPKTKSLRQKACNQICWICGYQSRYLRSLLDHINIEHPNEPHWTDPIENIEYQIEFEQQLCVECLSIFINLQSFQKHNRENHYDKLSQSEYHDYYLGKL